jgi:hypothetical protein
MDAFVQATVSSMNQSTSLIDKESVQEFPSISKQNENLVWINF